MLSSKELLTEMRRDLLAADPPQGVSESAVPGLYIYRYEAERPLTCSCGSLAVSIILSGRKSVTIGATELTYSTGEGLLSGAAVPSSFRAIGATAEEPFLAVGADLDRSVLLELAQSLPASNRPASTSSEAIFVFEPDTDLLVDIHRLIRLLKTPELIALRAPAILRDLHSLVLSSAAAPRLLPLLQESAPACTVVRAISWLRENYRKPIVIEELARMHGMSVSNFHRQFKAVTGLSPLQFQKQIRLYEAQHLMLSRRAQVSEAAYAVGYESPTQFVREYKRLFGDSPLRDVRRRRALEGIAPAAEYASPQRAAEPIGDAA